MDRAAVGLAGHILTGSPGHGNRREGLGEVEKTVVRSMVTRQRDPVSAISHRKPFDEFARWFSEAQASEPRDANAMTVATVTPEGAPAARMILLKGVDERGFVFYTNLDSRKGGEIAANPRVALCF